MNTESIVTRSLMILAASILLQSSFLRPASQAALVAASNGTDLSIVNGETNPVLGFPSAPDITSIHGITIGGAIGGAGGHFSPWGGTITLSAADAVVVSGGRCAFNVSYDMRNLGTTPTSPPFKNSLRLGSTEVSSQTGLSLAAGATQQIDTQAYLDAGTHILSLTLDSDHVVAESNEANNVRKVTVRVNCAAMPDITSQHGVTIGGAIGGAGGHFSPWGGLITLSPSDALPGAGKTCAFNISYDMENIGAGPTSPAFLNRWRNDSTVVSTQSSLSIAAGANQQINTQAYLSSGNHILSLSLDDGHVVAESNESNNVRRVKIRVNCP